MGKNILAKSVGKAIARQRNIAGMTQAQVGEQLGIEKETVSRLETGAISPTLARLQQLSDIFGCPVRHFFWQETADEQTQADTIADMIRTLPDERREMVVRFVADLARILGK